MAVGTLDRDVVDDPVLAEILEHSPVLPTDTKIEEFYGTERVIVALKRLVDKDYAEGRNPEGYSASKLGFRSSISDLPEDILALSDQVGGIEAKLVVMQSVDDYSTLQKALSFGFPLIYRTLPETDGTTITYKVGVVNPIERES